MAHKWQGEAQFGAEPVPNRVLGSLNIQLDAASDLPIMEQLAEGLAKNLSRVIDAFRSLDADGSGTIDKKEWREGLARVGLAEVPREQVDALFDEIDADQSGEIEYNELSRKLRKQNPDSPTEVVVLDITGRDVRRGWRNVAKLREVHRPTDLWAQTSGHRQTMAPPAMAATLSPNLEVARRMAATWQSDTSPRALEAVLQRVVKQAGSLSIQLDAASDVPIGEQLAEGLAKNLSRVIDLFRAWDDDSSGTIDRKEFRRGLHQLGLTEVPRAEVDALFDEIDEDQSGEIDLRELAAKLKTKQRAKLSSVAAASVAVAGSNRWLERMRQPKEQPPCLMGTRHDGAAPFSPRKSPRGLLASSRRSLTKLPGRPDKEKETM